MVKLVAGRGAYIPELKAEAGQAPESARARLLSEFLFGICCHVLLATSRLSRIPSNHGTILSAVRDCDISSIFDHQIAPRESMHRCVAACMPYTV